MERILKVIGLFVLLLALVSTTEAQQVKKQYKHTKVKVHHEKRERVLYPAGTTVRIEKDNGYAYGKNKTVPPGWSKGKKTGWTKGKGNKH